MIITKIINNNFVCAMDDNGREIVAYGNGVGFRRKKGDIVYETLIHKIYVPDKKRNMFNASVQGLPYEILSIAKDIMDYGSKRFDLKLKDSVFFSLCDHLNFAVERFKSDVDLDNPFKYEIKNYFDKEYKTASIAKEKILDKFGVTVSDDEICYIAMRLVEGEDFAFTETFKTNIGLIDEIMRIIETELNITEESKESYQYNRMLTHIKYFVSRYFAENQIKKGNRKLYTVMKEEFSKEFECVQRISDLLLEKYQKPIDESEVVYLTMHIQSCCGNDVI